MVVERVLRMQPAHEHVDGSISPDFLDALGVAVYTTDATGVITQYNRAAAELWGRRPDVGKDMWCGSWRLFFPDGSPMTHDECPMGIALREDRIVRDVEAVAERPDGTRVWFMPYPTPLHDEHGQLVGAVNVLVDITKLKQAQNAAAHLNAIVASSDDAIVSKSLDGVVLSWNPGAEGMFGYAAEEMIGRSIRTIIPPDRQEEEDLVLTRIRQGERVEHFETIRLTKDGRSIPISLTVSPVKDDAGRIVGASKIARDITERKLADRQLLEALAAKDEFIGLVSHELRTPLTAILGNAAFLMNRSAVFDREQMSTLAEDLYVGAQRLGDIIEDLLSLARLDGGQFRAEPVALRHVVQRNLDEYTTRTGRRVCLSVDGEAPIVLADDRIIGRVLSNYLSNADKYSPDSSTIEVIIDATNRAGRVRVLDRGLGIDPTEAEKVFDPFYRSKNVGNIAGIGIGLSVCRRLAEASGGTCWAAPRDGGGTEFGLSLPIDDDTLFDASEQP